MKNAENINALLARLCDGDAQAAEQVYREYEPYLRTVVRRQLPLNLRAKFDSFDVVQSLWVDLIDRFRNDQCRFSDADHLRAFLIRATRNRFHDHCRRHRAELEHEQPTAGRVGGEAAAVNQPTPSQVVQSDDLWQQIISTCPAEHRQIIELKRAGMSLSDIVARTGLHEGSVRRILRQLARRVALQMGGDIGRAAAADRERFATSEGADD
jgi:RNA polymerase sigma-70 factor (ECF subfamily)